MKKTKSRRSNPMPDNRGCYIETGFRREVRRKYLQAAVVVHHYKGRMLLSVVDENMERDADRFAWLQIHDIDKVIAMLREARRVCRDAHLKTARLLAKERR